jgi:hypothetical protein
MQITIEDDWIHAERQVTTENGNKIIRKSTKTEVDGSDPVSLNVNGDDSSFEAKVPESQLPSLFEMMTGDSGEENAEQEDSLPDEFFEQLSSRQEILLKILMKHDEPITGPDIRDEMRTEYGQEVSDSGSGIAGINSGITRKYSKNFRSDLIQGRVSHHNDEGSQVYEFWIGKKYKEDLRDHFDGNIGGDDDSESPKDDAGDSDNRSYQTVEPNKLEPGQKVKYILKTVYQDTTTAPYEGTLTISEVVKDGDDEDDRIILYFEYGQDKEGVSTRRAVYDHKSDKDPEYQKARMSNDGGGVECWETFGTEGGLDLFYS